MKTIDTKSYLDALCELVEEGKTVSTVVSGGSMLPFLSPERDFVYLNKVSRTLKKGDIVLYKRKNGNYVLHRIKKIKGDEFLLIGDRQSELECGIKREDILALCTEAKRNGRIINEKSLVWWFYKHIWLLLIPFRSTLIKLKNPTRSKSNTQ